MEGLRDKLFISTVAQDAPWLAREYGLGLEIAEFCTAFNMDIEAQTWISRVRENMGGLSRFLFHAPYNELCPAAVDPLIIEVARQRYTQAYGLMQRFGIHTMIVHSGFMKVLYEEEWFIRHSVEFWKRFLEDKPPSFVLHLENVFEEDPVMLIQIISRVQDKRFRLCLDIGHAALAGARLPMDDWIEQAAPYLGHVHLHNNHGERDTHNSLGDGLIDIMSILQSAMKNAPQASYTIEATSASASIAWLVEHKWIER